MTVVASVAHLLNRWLEVHRPVTTPDGSGGQEVTFLHVGDVRAKVDQPTPDERREADQWGAEHTHTARFLPSANVARGDELRGDDQVFRVLATVQPSHPVYLRAPVELIQSESSGVALFPGLDLFPADDVFPIGV